MKSQCLTTEQGIEGFPGPSGRKHRNCSVCTRTSNCPQTPVSEAPSQRCLPCQSAQDGDSHRYRSWDRIKTVDSVILCVNYNSIFGKDRSKNKACTPVSCIQHRENPVTLCTGFQTHTLRRHVTSFLLFKFENSKDQASNSLGVWVVFKAEHLNVRRKKKINKSFF